MMQRPPFLLVRVQDDLHGAHVTERGLRLMYQRDSEFAEYRNTLHWSVNCVVSDHVYGRFNEASDGSLIGNIVIIADPRELPLPAGLGEVDTWYRMDAAKRSDGCLERGLDVGRNAVIIAPKDTKVPRGVRVIHYDGGISERDAAVHRALRDAGIEPKAAGMWSWRDGSGGIERKWAREAASNVYGLDAARVHLGPHSSSIDDAIEAGARLAGMVSQFETERLYTLGDGSEVPMIEQISSRIRGQREALETILDAMTPAERARTGPYYEQRLSSLLQTEARASEIDQFWSDRMAVPDSAAVPPPLPMASALQASSHIMDRSPEQALASFRAGRMAIGVEAIGRAATRFDQEVTSSLSGSRTAMDSIKALTKAFVDSYRALNEAQDSATIGSVVNHETTDALRGVLRTVKDDFGNGIEQMRNDLKRLESHSPGDYSKFCETARDKIGRLETFWKQAAKTAPTPRI